MSAVLEGRTSSAMTPRLPPATVPPLPNALTLTLTRVVDLTPQIRAFTLRAPGSSVLSEAGLPQARLPQAGLPQAGSPEAGLPVPQAGLPEYVPGSHILVRCGEHINAYSLTGTGVNPSEYTISVLRLPDGAGGSRALHALQPGDLVEVSRPRSAFAPVASARHHLLIAAGIGITPMLSHLAAARDWNRSVSLLYAYRAGSGAHLEDVRAFGLDDLVESTTREHFRRTLEKRLRSQPVGTHLYLCGPPGFTDAVLLAAEEAGWPDQRVHHERFGATALDAGTPFTVRLARSGHTLPVAAGQSLLEALETTGAVVPNLCRRGICGECALPVLSGTPLHRDLYLSPERKAANDTILCCVSRGHENELELDL